MNKKTLLIAALFALALTTCKKDKDDDDDLGFCSNYATEYAEETNTVYAAMMAYASNPTHETCVAYKDAYQDYIDALKKFSNCATLWTPQEKANWQASLDLAEDNITTLCDE